MATGEPFLGGARAGNVFGTMWHGALEGDELRRAWLSQVASIIGRAGFEPGQVSFDAYRQRRIDTLADVVETHLDMAALLDLVMGGAPTGLPVIRGGLE